MDRLIAVPGPHPSHPIPPFSDPPKPVDDPMPDTTPENDPDPKPIRPVIDPTRGVRQPPPVHAKRPH